MIIPAIKNVPNMLIGLMLIVLSTQLWANSSATDAAFSALLSEHADQQPEGFAKETPEDYIRKTEGEADLINYLSLQKAKGADFNQYLHQGTLLHHAIRSHLPETARWLLKNGAQPNLRLAAGQNYDAMSLAIYVGEWDTVDAIRKMPAYKNLSDTQFANTYWPIALSAEKLNVAQMQRRFSLPRFEQTPKVAQSLLNYSLCTQNLALAQTLLSNNPALVSHHDLAKPAWVCDVSYAKNTPLASLPSAKNDWQEWRAIEQKLNYPITAYLMVSDQAQSSMQELLNAKLQAPWQQPQILKQLLRTALLMDWSYAAPLIKKIPSDSLKIVLTDKEIQRTWLKIAANWPLADLEWALKQVDSAQLGAVINTVIYDWAYAEATRREAKNQQDRTQRWALLGNQFKSPLAGKDGAFLYHVPIELWPKWFNAGYSLSDDSWTGWMRGVSVNDLKQAWPSIKKYQPEVAKQSLTWLIAPLSDSGYWWGTQTANALFLHEQSVRVAKPNWLSAAFLGKEWLKENHALIDLAMVKIPPENMRHAFEPVKQLACKSVTSPALRRALAPNDNKHNSVAKKLAANETFVIEGVQAIEFPNQSQCVWLGGGGQTGGRQFIDEEDFFQGTWRLTPCADGDYQSVLWDESINNFVGIDATLDGEVFPIRHKASGQLLYVSGEVGMGGCGTRAGAIFKPTLNGNGKPELVPIKTNDSLFEDLLLQCGLTNIVQCFNPPAEDIGAGNEQNWKNTPSLFAKDKADFFAAIDTFNRAVLAEAKKAGIFSTWYNEVITRVNDNSTWTLTEKRQRMAWLLAQRYLLSTIDSSHLAGFAKWLPAEDWRPIIETYLCTHTDEFRDLIQAKETKNNKVLYQKLKIAEASCKPQ